MKTTSTQTMRAIASRDALVCNRGLPAENYDAGLRAALGRRFPAADVRVRTAPGMRETRVSWGPESGRKEAFFPAGSSADEVSAAIIASYQGARQ